MMDISMVVEKTQDAHNMFFHPQADIFIDQRQRKKQEEKKERKNKQGGAQLDSL
jgi:hypothetical protein